MSASDAHPGGRAVPPDEYPRFDLRYRFDDSADPAEVTVFLEADDHDLVTHWITIDRSHAVPLEDIP